MLQELTCKADIPQVNTINKLNVHVFYICNIFLNFN